MKKTITIILYFLMVVALSEIELAIKNYKPVDLVSLTDKYDRIIAGKNAEIISQKAALEEIQNNNADEWEAEREFVDNRCVCKEYSGKLDSATGQYIETINPKQLSKQEICK